MTANADPQLAHLYERLGERIAFATRYVREAHPGDRYPQPETFERKLELARGLKERDGLPRPVAVDGIDGELHRNLDQSRTSAMSWTRAAGSHSGRCGQTIARRCFAARSGTWLQAACACPNATAGWFR